MNRQTYRAELHRIQKKYEEKYFPMIRDAIKGTVDDVSGVVKNGGAVAGISYLNKEISNTKLTAIIQRLALEVGLRFARRTWIELQAQKRAAKRPLKEYIAEYGTKDFIGYEQKGFGFNAEWVEWIKRFLFDFIVQKISFSVFETTKETLIRVLNDAISGGWGIDKTVQALDELSLPASQAARIARTEITRATNAGASAAAETFPYQQQKEWISAHDKRVRDNEHASHVMLNGQVVDYEDVFRDPVSHVELRWPGDPLAPAAETINCRCSHAVTAKLTEEGRLIPKRVSTVVIYPTTRRQTIITI